MPDNLSQRILDFLMGMPQFHRDPDYSPGKWVARRMTDGTILMAPSDPEDQEEGYVIAHWQGDAARSSRLIGEHIAAMEIAEGVRIWVATGEYTDPKAGYAHLAQHFAFKTGTSISCGFEEENQLMLLAGRFARKFGSDALISILKAKLGIP